MYRIPLRVGNVHFDDDATVAQIGDRLADLAWSEVDGVVIATFYGDCDDPVGMSVQTARRIKNALPDADVHEVDPDLVGVSDIAQRVGVSREAVRLWAEGKRAGGTFPPSIGAVAGGGNRGSIRVWRWPDVEVWLREHYSFDADERALAPEQVAAVNAALLRVRELVDREWENIESYEQQLSMGARDRAAFRADPLAVNRYLEGLQLALRLVHPVPETVLHVPAFRTHIGELREG
jgi:hypothetical protein